jgi:hypothetical protein
LKVSKTSNEDPIVTITIDFASTSALDDQLTLMQAKCDSWLASNKAYAEALLAENGDNKANVPDGPVRISVQIGHASDRVSLLGRVHLYRPIRVESVCDDSINSLFFVMGLYSDFAVLS